MSIRVDGIRKTFGGFAALDDISLNVPQGELVEICHNFSVLLYTVVTHIIKSRGSVGRPVCFCAEFLSVIVV